MVLVLANRGVAKRRRSEQSSRASDAAHACRAITLPSTLIFCEACRDELSVVIVGHDANGRPSGKTLRSVCRRALAS